MGAALADPDSFDRRAAVRAGLAGAAIGPEGVLKASAAVDPINAGPIAEDALLQDGTNGFQ